MMSRSKIHDTPEFRRMWADLAIPTHEIAAAYDVKPPAIRATAKRLGLKPRPNGCGGYQGRDARAKKQSEASKVQDPAPITVPVIPHPFFTIDHDAAIMTTKGAYAELAKLAEDWGQRIQRVQARFHRLMGGCDD